MPLPTWIKINGSEVAHIFRDAPEGSPIGDYSISVNPIGGLVFVVVRHKGDPLRWMVFNALEDMSLGVFIKLTWDDMLVPPHKLGSQQGYQWIDEEKMESIHHGVTTPWDAWWKGTVDFAFPAIDVPNTATTGSPHTLHHDPSCVMMRRHGVSPMGARWLSTYLDFQLLRSRHRWNGARIVGADGKIEPPIAGFAYGKPNQHDVTPYDPGHMTVTRLTEGFQLTRDPTYLYAAIHAVCHPIPHASTLTNPWKAYNAREQCGWPPKAYANLALVLLDNGMEHVFSGLIGRLIDLSTNAFKAGFDQFPLIDPYAKPEIFVDGTKVLYTHAWHYAPVLFACELWRKIIATHDASLVNIGLGAKAQTLYIAATTFADLLSGWFNGPLWNQLDQTVAVHVAPSIVEYQHLTGVATWYAAGLGLLEEPGPLYAAIVQQLKSDYPESSGPQKHQYALNTVPQEFGYQIGPYPQTELEGGT